MGLNWKQDNNPPFPSSLLPPTNLANVHQITSKVAQKPCAEGNRRVRLGSKIPFVDGFIAKSGHPAICPDPVGTWTGHLEIVLGFIKIQGPAHFPGKSPESPSALYYV